MMRPGAPRRRWESLTTGVLVAGALGYIGLVDPHRRGGLDPPCILRLLTGWNCPACGGLRMTHDLLHGQVAAAAMDNVALLVGFPILAAWVILRHRRGTSPHPVLVSAAVVLAVIGWTVVRNLPGFPLVPTLMG